LQNLGSFAGFGGFGVRFWRNFDQNLPKPQQIHKIEDFFRKECFLIKETWCICQFIAPCSFAPIFESILALLGGPVTFEKSSSTFQNLQNLVFVEIAAPLSNILNAPNGLKLISAVFGGYFPT
jgi:hypothetical protein